MATAAEKEKQLDELLASYKGFKGATIPVLQKAQDIYGYLPKEVLVRISKGIDVPISKIYGVVTFYAQFHLEPRGKYIIRSCQGTACHVRGASKVLDAIRRQLELAPNEQTTQDGLFTLETIACIGACALAPVITVGDHTHGRLTADEVIKVISQYSMEADTKDAD